MEEFIIDRYLTTSMLKIKRNGNGGSVPKELSGVYTKYSHAEAAIAAYLSNRKEKVDYTPESTPQIELEKLTKKKDLMTFADVFKLEVPEELKQPASIKKWIGEQINA